MIQYCRFVQHIPSFHLSESSGFSFYIQPSFEPIKMPHFESRVVHGLLRHILLGVSTKANFTLLHKHPPNLSVISSQLTLKKSSPTTTTTTVITLTMSIKPHLDYSQQK